MKQNGIQTQKISREWFDECFKRTYNVEFVFNTDVKEFRRKYKYGEGADKPILVIFWPEYFMSNMIDDFQKVLRNYNEVFDVFYFKDQQKANQYFETSKMPKEVPHLYIVDPKGLKAVKTQNG